MFGNGSMLVLFFVVAGTLAALGFIRMIGFYAAATQDYAAALESASKSHASTRRGGTDPILLIAIISAAAAAELEVESVQIKEIHEVSVPQSSHDWGAHGRQLIFQSHRLRS